MNTPDRLGIGGNNPPIVDPIKLAEAESLTQAALVAAKAVIEAGPIEDAGRASEISDVVATVRGAFSAVDKIRAELKKPHDDAGAEVQKAFKVFLTALEADGKKIKAMQAAWLEAEDARIAAETRAREEEARKAQEAAWAEQQMAEARGDTLAAAKAAEQAEEAEKLARAAAKPEKARAESASGGGRTMSLRTQAYAEITNWRAVYMRFEDEAEVREVLQRLADRAVRAGEVPPGANRAERKIAA